MKCKCCPKNATWQITEIHGPGKYEDISLCEECAQQYLFETSAKKKPTVRENSDELEKQCEHCGIRFVDFRNTGRLGCAHDYELFRAELLPLLESIHGATRHTGKVPRRPSRQRRSSELARLRQELQKAIQAEAYEEAARLRDRIRQLEQG